jgi:hypothetical protein
VVWAPEFFEFPGWGHGVELMFAEAPRRHRVGRLVFAHIGRPPIRAIDRGEQPVFGEFARDGQVFRVTGRR